MTKPNPVLDAALARQVDGLDIMGGAGEVVGAGCAQCTARGLADGGAETIDDHGFLHGFLKRLPGSSVS